MRPFSIAAAAVEELSCVLFSIAALLLRPFSIVAAAVEEKSCVLFSIAALLLVLYCGSSTAVPQ